MTFLISKPLNQQSFITFKLWNHTWKWKSGNWKLANEQKQEVNEEEDRNWKKLNKESFVLNENIDSLSEQTKLSCWVGNRTREVRSWKSPTIAIQSSQFRLQTRNNSDKLKPAFSALQLYKRNWNTREGLWNWFFFLCTSKDRDSNWEGCGGH